MEKDPRKRPNVDAGRCKKTNQDTVRKGNSMENSVKASTRG